jgi:hypothetical protein
MWGDDLPSIDSLHLPAGRIVDEGDEAWAVRVMLTPDQWSVVCQALVKIRTDAGEGPEMTDGRALELMAADYLAGP